MKFHPQKCTVIRIRPNNKFKRETRYSLHGHTLEVETTSKYLGVNISEDLSWKHHTEVTANKANKTVGFLRRNLRDCSKKVRNAAYTALVRPTLEYACTAWDPHTAEDITCLDHVQRRAARFESNNYHDKTPMCNPDDQRSSVGTPTSQEDQPSSVNAIQDPA